MSLKWFALFCLVLQNSALSLFMRYTFIEPEGSNGDHYVTSTAVCLSELLKFTISLVTCFIVDGESSPMKFLELCYIEFWTNRIDWLKLMIPSLLYTLQNSLQYYSMSQLSAPVFQVMYQMKIITTAVFSVIMLSKHLLPSQWLSIITLAVGVALVQLSQLSNGKRVKLRIIFS